MEHEHRATNRKEFLSFLKLKPVFYFQSGELRKQKGKNTPKTFWLNNCNTLRRIGKQRTSTNRFHDKPFGTVILASHQFFYFLIIYFSCREARILFVTTIVG